MSQTRVIVGAGTWTSQKKSGGLFRAVAGNGGWESITKGLPTPVSVQAVTFHRTERDVVFAGTQDGPYRSNDGGASWERPKTFPSNLQVWSIAVHPKSPKTIFAGTSPVGIWRSDDGGVNWHQLPNVKQPDRIKMSFACRTMRLAVVPGSPDQIFAALEVGGVIRSLDGGDHWDDCADELVTLSSRPNLKSKIQSDSEAEGMLDAHALTVSDAAPGSVFLAVRMGLFRSDDRATKWNDLEVGRFSPLTYGRDIRTSPHDPRTLYAALSPAARSTDGSLYRSTDLGTTWARVDHGVKANATMMGLALHPRDPNEVYCASRCGQVFGTQDGGKTWSESTIPVDDVYAIACG
jgi:photosystem II stability/assembly factor-like uncharacterized protein